MKRMASLVVALVLLATAPATLGTSAFASTGRPTITSRVLHLLSPGGGKPGLYLYQVGKGVLAKYNETYAFEPASSIKAEIALYAMTRVAEGKSKLTDLVPKIVGPSAGDCPPSTIFGKEPLGTAIQQMLRVSDNNRTRELMQFFGVKNLNAFAKSKGLLFTHFYTVSTVPGFTIIGCANNFPFTSNPHTVDGNTTTLVDLSKVWLDATQLPSPYAEEFMQLAAGREMFNSQGYDFTGVWPALVKIAQQEAPSGMSAGAVETFINHMTDNSKGGSYDLCTSSTGCSSTRWWLISAGHAEIPHCNSLITRGSRVSLVKYLWGYYISGANGPASSATVPAITAFNNATGELLREQIRSALSTWAPCAGLVDTSPSVVQMGTALPTVVPLSVTLATFTEPSVDAIAPSFKSTILWGDGSTSEGTVVGSSGHFTVRGWHRFGRARTMSALVQVIEVGGPPPT